MRVHELARELGVASKVVLAALEEMGLEGRMALSSVPEEAAPRLRASVWITTRTAVRVASASSLAESGRPQIGGPGGATPRDIAVRSGRTPAEVVDMVWAQLKQRTPVPPGPPSPGPITRWRARRAVREELGPPSGSSGRPPRSAAGGPDGGSGSRPSEERREPTG